MKSLQFPFACLCLALAGCASSKEIPKGGPVDAPRAPSGFVATAESGAVLVEAKFNSSYEEEFGELIEDERLIPIRVKFVNANKTSDLQKVDINVDNMEFRLLLQDGASLEAVKMGSETIAKGNGELRKRLERRALPSGLLVSESEGYVYFRLSPKDAFEFEDGDLVHYVGDIERRVKLSQSLLSFRLVVQGKPSQLFLGLSR